MSQTPMRKDKRFLLTVGVVSTVFAMTWAGKVLSEQVLTFIGVTVGAFMAQSQAGQTIRATKTPPGGANGNG